MKTLVMALFAEGNTDDRFLRIVARHTATHILRQHSPNVVDVLAPQIIRPRSNRDRAEHILHAAHDAHGYHLLLVHADADAPTRDAAWNERVEPGFLQVQQAVDDGERVCDKLVAVIPVQMTEAWMLVDTDALLAVIGTTASPADLGLIHGPIHVERIADPKWTLQEAMRIALSHRPRRRRQRGIADLYEPLARRIDLARLRLVPAYRQFQTDLRQALIELHFVRSDR